MRFIFSWTSKTFNDIAGEIADRSVNVRVLTIFPWFLNSMPVSVCENAGVSKQIFMQITAIPTKMFHGFLKVQLFMFFPMAVSKIFGDVTLLNANFMKNVEEVLVE